jgi:hypothetical protein
MFRHVYITQNVFIDITGFVSSYILLYMYRQVNLNRTHTHGKLKGLTFRINITYSMLDLVLEIAFVNCQTCLTPGELITQ